jgi:predicted permease
MTIGPWLRGLRTLRRTPGFTVIAILILGLGIGVATAMISVFDSAVLRPLPVRDQDRVVVMWPLGAGGTEIPFDSEEFRRLQSNSRTLESLAGFVHWGAVDAALADGDTPRRLRMAQVTSNFFTVLGASAVVGRLLVPADRAEGDEHVMVISYAVWQRLFAGDRRVVGRQLKWLSAAQSYTVVGVAPPGLDYPLGADVWIALWPKAPVDLLGRLKRDATAAAAEAELAAAVADYQRRTGDKRGVGAFARSLPEVVYGNVRPVLLVMTVAAGLLLLIACINVGNLLLLRAAARRREIAVRRALGASPGDLFAQLFAESGVLALGGGALGLGIASLLLRLFVTFAPRTVPRMEMIRLAGAPLLVAIGATLLTVGLTGLVPLLSSRRRGADASILRLDGRAGMESRDRRRLRYLLVAGQMALALVVLDGASLLGRSLIRLETQSLGYRPDRMSVLELVAPLVSDTSYRTWISYVDKALPAIRAVPGVIGASPVLAPPFTGSNTFTLALEAEGGGDRRTPIVSFDAVGPDYFRATDLRLLRGRSFTDDDRVDTPPVAIVTNTIARWLWPGQDPIGKRVRFLGDTATNSWRTIIGVSDDLHFRDFRAATPMVFLEYHQLSFWQGTLVVRTRETTTTILGEIQRAVRRGAPELTFWRAPTMTELLSEPLARPRTDAMLLGGFAVAAILLAAIGLYAVIGWTVRQRHRELGIRMALGAGPGRLRALVLGESLRLVVAGGVAGIVVAMAGSRLLTRVLFQVSPNDPIALLAAGAALGTAGLIAAYLPARQATEIDPVRALRAE